MLLKELMEVNNNSLVEINVFNREGNVKKIKLDFFNDTTEKHVADIELVEKYNNCMVENICAKCNVLLIEVYTSFD